MFLSGEEKSQQVEGVDVVSLKLQRLSDVSQRLRDLHTNTTGFHWSWDNTQSDNEGLYLTSCVISDDQYLSGNSELQRQVEGCKMVSGRQTVCSAAE